MNFSASIPVAQMQAANATLESQGFGPNNFSVPAYAGPSPSHALLHCWHSPVFEAAVAAIPGVVIQQALADPVATTTAVANTANTDWSSEAKPLTGTVTPGLHQDADGVLWWVIQSYNTAIWTDPMIIPALIRRAKIPGEALPWVQPLDQFDAYKLENAFTGEPDECTHNGKTWRVSAGDGAGNNVWEPGVFGWVEIVNGEPVPEPVGYPAWVQPTGAHDAYVLGAKVTHNGFDWENTGSNANVWEPGVFGWVKI